MKPIKDMTLEEYTEYYTTAAPNYPYLDNFNEGGPHWHRSVFYFKHIRPHHKVLDVGCSNGGTAKFLTERIGCSVFAFDIAPFFAQNAQVNAPMAICGAFPVEKTPFVNGVFDIIVAGEVLEHVLDINIALKELLRVLRPGGLLLATTPVGDDDHNSQHLRFLGGNEWNQLLPGCQVERTQYSWLMKYQKP